MRENVFELKPFFSVLIIISTLFAVVFMKMEVRRQGYTVLKQTREYKILRDRYRNLVTQYAKITTPERVRKFAQTRLTLNDAKNGQIIQLTGQNLAVPQ